jgi:hypothetical protein
LDCPELVQCSKWNTPEYQLIFSLQHVPLVMKISRRAIVRYYSHQAIQTLFQVFEKRFGMKQRKPKLKRNSPGRPRLRYKGLAIVMRLPPDELKALDRWIKADGALLSRQQAIRRILSIALRKSTSKVSSAPG